MSAPQLDVGLIVVAVIIPFVLVFFNLVVMAHYIDPEAAAGHLIAKLSIVSQCIIFYKILVFLHLTFHFQLSFPIFYSSVASRYAHGRMYCFITSV